MVTTECLQVCVANWQALRHLSHPLASSPGELGLFFAAIEDCVFRSAQEPEPGADAVEDDLQAGGVGGRERQRILPVQKLFIGAGAAFDGGGENLGPVAPAELIELG